jgi:hypothetical protein
LNFQSYLTNEFDPWADEHRDPVFVEDGDILLFHDPKLDLPEGDQINRAGVVLGDGLLSPIGRRIEYIEGGVINKEFFLIAIPLRISPRLRRKLVAFFVS